MPFDDILKRSLDALASELSSAVQAERDAAARRAKDVADESVAAAITDAQAVAEQRGMMAGREEGLAEGRRQGFNQGRQEGYDAGKSDGYRIGKEEGFLAGKGAGANADAADQATGERLADAMRAIDRSRSLSEILDTLASCAGPGDDPGRCFPRARGSAPRMAVHWIRSRFRSRQRVRSVADRRRDPRVTPSAPKVRSRPTVPHPEPRRDLRRWGQAAR